MHEDQESAFYADMRTGVGYFVLKETDAEVTARRSQLRDSGEVQVNEQGGPTNLGVRHHESYIAYIISRSSFNW